MFHEDQVNARGRKNEETRRLQAEICETGRRRTGRDGRGCEVKRCGQSTRGAAADVRQEGGEQAEEREEGADLEDEREAGVVGEAAERGRADTAHAEGETEEKARDQADAVGEEFLGIDENGGERGGEDDADDDGEDGAPKQIRVGQQEGKGGGAQNGDPDDGLAADAVADGTADDRAGGDGGEKQEEEQLGVLDGDLEGLDEVERVVAPEAGQVEVFGENQDGEDGERRRQR